MHELYPKASPGYEVFVVCTNTEYGILRTQTGLLPANDKHLGRTRSPISSNGGQLAQASWKLQLSSPSEYAAQVHVHHHARNTMIQSAITLLPLPTTTCVDQHLS